MVRSRTSNDSIIYRQLVENMNEAVWMGDNKERTIYANPKFCELMEYSLEEMLDRESYEFWDEESAKQVHRANASDRKKGISSSYEGNLKSKSGKLIPVLLNGTPLPNGGTIGIMTDLRKIRERETIYRQLVENMNEAVWMGDNKERTIYANPKFCELMEYSIEEMLDRESYEFWDEESVKQVHRVNTIERKRGISSSYTGNLKSKSGKLIPVLLNGTPLPNGGTIGIMTDLRKIREIEEKEKILGNAVKHSADSIFLMEPSKILSWNKGGKLMFGYKEENIIGQSTEMVFSTETINKIFSNTGSQVHTLELPAYHKNGSIIYISATITVIYPINSSSSPLRLLIARDITNNHRIEEELVLKYKKLQKVYQEYGIISRRLDYFSELLHFAKKEHHNLGRLSDFIVNSVVMLTGADACILRYITSDKKHLKAVSTFGFEDWKGDKNILIEGSLAQKAFKTGAPLKIFDILQEPAYQSKQLARKNNLSSLLLLPLVFKNELIGSVTIYIKTQSRLDILENDFIELYGTAIETVLGPIVTS